MLINTVNSDYYTIAILKVCAWMGPGFVTVFLIGAVLLAGYIPPPPATNTAAETVAYFVKNLNMVRLGSIVMMFSSMLYAVWGAAVAIYTRVPEGNRPILFCLQLIFIAITTVDILFLTLFWCFGTYRPDELIYDITQMWNDAAWIALLITVPPFTAWCFTIAASIFGDGQGTLKFPRWAAYFNVWAGVLFLPAVMMLFFKSGPFSQTGIIVFWIPVCVFFVWIVGMTYLLLKAIRQDELEILKQG